jgi:hypothetical protein
MIGHQDIRMDETTSLSAVLAKPVKIEKVILSTEETCLPIIPPLNDMEWYIRYDDSWSPWHN